MHVIRYHRFSSKKQDKGSSLDRQRATTQVLCEAHGWTIVETLEDRGQSAWKGDHLTNGELGKLRKRIDAGLIDVGTILLVENLDRLSRQGYRIARRWIEDVTDRGIIVRVCSPDLTLDTQAMSGANILAVLQYLLESNRSTAEAERKSVFQKNNIARMTDMMRNGICPSPRVPAWLHGIVGERVSPIRDRAALVNLIYEWSASGLGLQTICKQLNASHRPWTKPGWKTGVTQWRIGYVRDILTSAAVEGKYAVNGPDQKPTGEIILGYYPRIVDAELVGRARAAMAFRVGTGGPGRGEAMNYFQGMMTCGRCKGAVGRVVGGQGYAYLQCRRSRYGTCDNKTGMPYDTLARIVVDHLLQLALDDTHFASTDNIGPLMAKASDAKSTIDTLRTEQSNLMQFLRRMPTSESLIAELGRLDADLQTAKANLIHCENEVTKARGAVSPGEHLSRVKAVRDSLDTDAEARRMVKDALPAIIDRMVWNGEQVWISSSHFVMKVERDGTISGWDLFHPRAGHASDPEYGRRRDAAQENGTFMPLIGGQRRDVA